MSLNGVRIALLIEDEYQILEGWYPHIRLAGAGADLTVVGSGTKQSYDSKEHYPMEVDRDADSVSADDFDAVVVPGGFAPDNMRLHPEMAGLVRDMYAQGKLVTSICHGGWILISAGAARGKRITGYLPIKDDVENAGGTWVDGEPVIVDGNVITARNPGDLAPFCDAIIDYLESNRSAADASSTASDPKIPVGAEV
jgi:protease I